MKLNSRNFVRLTAALFGFVPSEFALLRLLVKNRARKALTVLPNQSVATFNAKATTKLF